jgi:hypothetical protein
MISQNINNLIDKLEKNKKDICLIAKNTGIVMELNLNRTLGPKYKTWTNYILRKAKRDGRIGKQTYNDNLEIAKIYPPNNNKARELIRDGKNTYKKSLVDRRQYIETTKSGLLNLIRK